MLLTWNYSRATLTSFSSASHKNTSSDSIVCSGPTGKAVTYILSYCHSKRFVQFEVNFERDIIFFLLNCGRVFESENMFGWRMLDLEGEQILLSILNTPNRVVCSGYGGQCVSQTCLVSTILTHTLTGGLVPFCLFFFCHNHEHALKNLRQIKLRNDSPNQIEFNTFQKWKCKWQLPALCTRMIYF